jgi:hypothetical protein
MAKRIETIPLLPHEEYSMGGTAGFQKIRICHCVVPEELHPVLVMSAATGGEGKTSVIITYLARPEHGTLVFSLEGSLSLAYPEL